MHPDIRVVPASVSGENGALVFVGQHLLAVLVHLEQEFYEQRDCWHVEASFFRHVGQPGRVFPTLFAAVTWVAAQEPTLGGSEALSDMSRLTRLISRELPEGHPVMFAN
jgi:hypothetical protein